MFWRLVKSASSNEVVRYVFSRIINFILLIIACNYAWTSHALGKGLRKLLQRKLKTKNVDLTKRQSLLPMIYLKQLDVSCTSLSDTCTAVAHILGRIVYWVTSLQGCHISWRQSHVFIVFLLFFFMFLSNLSNWHGIYDTTQNVKIGGTFFSTRFFAMNFMRY